MKKSTKVYFSLRDLRIGIFSFVSLDFNSFIFRFPSRKKRKFISAGQSTANSIASNNSIIDS